MQIVLNPADVKAMIEHWISTPANSYYGHGYGHDLRRLLMQPMSADIADMILDKLRQDIPLFANLDDSQLSIWSDNNGHEKKHVYLSIGSIMIPLSEADTNNSTGDTYHANAQ